MTRLWRFAALPVLALAVGCGGSSDGRTDVKMWSHAAGNPTEIKVTDKVIKEFNASQDKYRVKVEYFPQRAYNDAVVAAAMAGDTPCLLDMDGPVMPNWAWAKAIVPLDLPKSTTDKFLPSTLGKWNGKIYSVGYWDAALSIFARKSALEKAGVRIPTMAQPWTREEFDQALEAVKKTGGFKYPLDMAVADLGEWYPYAYSPLLQSFGGDLIDRRSYKTADGALNGPQAVAFGKWFQSLFPRDLASRTPSAGNIDFINGDAAMSWTGNWNAPAAIEKFKDDVIFLPP